MKKLLLILSLFMIINVKGKESINDYSNGIDGKIIQKSISIKLDSNDTEDSLILSSKTGIYIKKGNEYRYIKTDSSLVSVIVIDDINSDNVKDIVYATNTKDGNYNVVGVSGKDETVLWKKALLEKKFGNINGLNYNNIRIQKIESIEDKIVVLSDYSIYVLDNNTGDLIFKYKDKDNIWGVAEVKDTNNNLSNEIVLSNQLGEVKLIDSKTGKMLWNKKVIEDLTFKEDNITFKTARNIWQVEVLDNKIYAISENGILYSIDYKTGNIINKLVLNNFDEEKIKEYYLNNMRYRNNLLYKTYSKSEYYNNFEMIIKDNRIYVTQFFNAIDRNKPLNDDNKPKIIVIEDFKVINEFEIDQMSLVNVEPLVIDETIYVPIEIKNKSLVINKYSTKVEQQKIYVSNYLSVDSKDNIYFNSINEGILLEQKNTSSLILDNELKSIVKNNNSYSVADLIRSNNDELIVSYKSNEIIHKIERYDNLNNNTPLWEYNIPKDFLNNGLFSISAREDYNKDGIIDVTSLINKVDENNNTIATYFLILDSKTGNVLKFKPIHTGSYYQSGKRIDTYLTGNNLTPIKDINRDGIPELILDSYVIDGSKISTIGFFDQSINTQLSTIYSVGDINMDSIPDLAVFETSQISIYQSIIQSNSISYKKTNKNVKYSKEMNNIELGITIPDLNNDGIKEIVINDKLSDKQIFKILSGKDLSYMFTIKDLAQYEYGYTHIFLNQDINEDGFNDFYEERFGMSYRFLSGKDGSILLDIPLTNENVKDFTIKEDIMPDFIGVTSFNYTENVGSVALGIDLNKDSKKEIFLLKSEYYPQNKLTILAYDIYNKNLEPIRSFDIYFETTNYYREDMIIDEIDYNYKIIEVVNGDGLYLVKLPGTSTVNVYDAKSNKVLSEISSNILKAIKTSNDNIFGVTSKNNPIYINYKNDFKVNKDNDNSTSPLKIELNKVSISDMRLVKIYNKGILLDIKYDDSFDLKLKKGTYDLVFKSFDKYGKTQNYNLNITINKNNPLLIIISIVSIMFILIIIYISVGYKIKRNKRLRRVL